MTRHFTKKSISADGAQAVVAAAVAKARALGLACTIVVTDEDGQGKATIRMDGANALSADAAQRKAYTAASTGGATAELVDGIVQEPSLLHGVPHLPGITTLGGGLPILDGTDLIGAVGVSGGAWTDDVAVAAAGVAALASAHA